MAQFKSRKFAVAKLNGGDGSAVFINDQCAVSAAAVNTDTIDFILPKGIEVSYLKFFHTSLAASGMTASVGWANTQGSGNVVMNGVSTAPSATQFRASAAFGIGAAGFECDFAPVTFEEDVILRITLTASPVTPTAGTVHSIIGGNQIGVR